MVTVRMKQYTGTDGATESPSSSTSGINFNFSIADEYDSVGTLYLENPVSIPSSGSAYSYERILRFKFSSLSGSTFSSVKVHGSGVSLPTGVTLNAGVAASATTPAVVVSIVATSALPTTLGTALDITPTGGILADNDYTKYLYLQLKVASTATKIGDIGRQTITITYT